MRITIPDDYQNCISTLNALKILEGHEITILNEYLPDPKEFASKANDPEALVLTRTRTPINEALLDFLPNLKVVSQTGKNPGHIDVKACEQKGVTILEGRGNPIATAELTWALIMNGLRKIPQSIQGMKDGKWQTNLGNRVHGKKIGIWGYGKIGKMIANYAKAFGAKVIIWGSENSRQKAVQDGYEAADTKDFFFSNSDVISIHLRLKPETAEIISYDDLSKMKPNSLLVNTARAGLIKKGDLLKALHNGRPGFAAIDVYDKEPIFDPRHPYLQLPQVICTPHLGYVEKESYELYFGIAFDNLIQFINQ